MKRKSLTEKLADIVTDAEITTIRSSKMRGGDGRKNENR